MTVRFLCLIFALILAGCSSSVPIESGANVSSKAVAGTSKKQNLAYEHSLDLTIEQDKLAVLVSQVQDNCKAAPENACTLLESRITSSSGTTAHLKLRATSVEIKKLIALLTGKAKVTNQSTLAEDLTAPMFDIEKKVAMLSAYRLQLEALSKRANNDLDQLIRLSRELAQVDTDLEELKGRNARYVQRIETELLSISLSSQDAISTWRPVSHAMSDFGAHLAEGLAFTISSIAYLLPFLVFIMVFIFGVRKIIRRFRRAKI